MCVFILKNPPKIRVYFSLVVNGFIFVNKKESIQTHINMNKKKNKNILDLLNFNIKKRKIVRQNQTVIVIKIMLSIKNASSKDITKFS